MIIAAEGVGRGFRAAKVERPIAALARSSSAKASRTLVRIHFDVAPGFLDHRLLGLDHQPGEGPDIGADMWFGWSEPLRQRGDPRRLIGPASQSREASVARCRTMSRSSQRAASAWPKWKTSMIAIGVTTSAPIIASKGSFGELVEGGVEEDRDEIAGEEPPADGSRTRAAAPRVSRSASLVGDGGEAGPASGAVHQRRCRRPRTSQAPTADSWGKTGEVDDVLDDGEAGADGESRAATASSL